MSQITLDISLNQVREIVRQLPPQDLVTLAEEIEDQAETMAMMQLANSGFGEWNEPGEDIYDEPSEQK